MIQSESVYEVLRISFIKIILHALFQLLPILVVVIHAEIKIENSERLVNVAHDFAFKALGLAF